MCVFGGVSSGAVEMNMLNSVGESEDPCGTPCVGEKDCVERVWSVRMLIDLWVRKEFMSLVKW